MKEKKKGLYVHIPFCKYICTYCDFCKKYTHIFSEEKYINFILEELTLYEKNFKDITTIYIGGGTPSTLNLKVLKKLLDFLKININLNAIEEYTVEMNPDDVTKELIDLLDDSGVNRISLGVQSTNDNILKEVNRKYTKKDIQAAIDIINLKISNVNIDLMFNLPKQEVQDIYQDIEFLKLNQKKITHISYYSLILEEHTILNNKKHSNFSEEKEEYIYKYIQKTLDDLGYSQYEISNFSKKGFESKHNLKYWNQKEYIGVGIGASSFIDNIRYTNTRSLNRYYESISVKDNSRIIEQEVIKEEDKIEENIILGLRLLQGIEYDFIKEMKLNLNMEYFNINNGKVAIKKEYLFLSNNIIVDLLEQL